MSPWSEVTRTTVSSSRPSSFREEQRRPICSSTAVTAAAYAAISFRPPPAVPSTQFVRIPIACASYILMNFSGAPYGSWGGPIETIRKNGRPRVSRRNSIATSVHASASNFFTGIGWSVSRKYWVLKWAWLHSLAAQ